MTNKPNDIRIAILSTAHMHAASYAHCLNTMDGAALVALWDDDRQRGETQAQQYGTSYTPDLEAALAACDAAIVCSDNAHHLELVSAAAQAGKHVLCEKPLATSPEDAIRMIRECEDAGVLLGTAFPVRQSGGVMRLKDALSNGRFGDLIMVRGTNRGLNPGGWFIQKALAGGGALTDHTVHVVDSVRFATGLEVESVYAEMDTVYNPHQEVEDCGLLIMTLSNGAPFSLDPSWSRPAKAFPTWGDVTIQAIGTEAVADFDMLAPHTNLYSNSRVRAVHLPWGDSSDMLMVEDFVGAVREGRSPLASGVDGLRAVEVVKAAYSSVEQRQPVRVEHLIA